MRGPQGRRNGASSGQSGPLDSALLPGVASALVVDAGDRLTDDPRVIGLVARILREHLAG